MKYQFIILLLGILLIFNACSPKRSTVAANTIPTLALSLRPTVEILNFQKTPNSNLTPKLLLSLERFPCFGKCPVYKIEFFENGLVQYNGGQHTNLIGQYSTKISKAALHDLLQYAFNINYSELSSVYPTSGKTILDVPLTITYVKYGSEINQIENHHHAPVDLVKFEEHIELLIDNLDFKLVN